MQLELQWCLEKSAFGHLVGVRRLVLCWTVSKDFGFSHHEDFFTINLLYNGKLKNFVPSMLFAKITLQ
jgi:hypothetical protein